MPTELEELVEFLHHGNTDIRKIAAENLVGYSQSDPTLFKRQQLTPIKDLKLLVKDYTPISKNALTMLINLSNDSEILEDLVKDDAFLETLLLRLTKQKEPNANEIAMLFANLAKSDKILRLLQLKRSIPKPLSTSEYAIDQIMDCFVKGADGSYNKEADYDYLSYFFADLATHPECRQYFTQPQERDDNIIPLSKLTVFTDHKSDIRRRGVASTIKNVAFEVPGHPNMMDSDAVNILPYLLSPLMGSEDYSEEDMDGMLEELQLQPPDKERDKDAEILKTHLETLLLLTSTREGRDQMRRVKVYPIIRETHLHVENEDIREACDRVVQIIMRDEEGEGNGQEGSRIEEIDEEEEIQEVF